MRTFLLGTCLVFAVATSTWAANAKSYQVTGPVISTSDTTITVQKGKDAWEINKGTATIPADIKVGTRVTISYTMTADSLEVKPPKEKKKDAKEESATPAPAAKP